MIENEIIGWTIHQDKILYYIQFEKMICADNTNYNFRNNIRN